MPRRLLALVGAGALLVLGTTGATTATAAKPPHPRTTVVQYDSFSDGDGYTLADYSAKWSNGYGLGELAPTAHGDTRVFDNDTFSLSAVPFLTGADFSVFDHIKYLATSNQAFTVPDKGSVRFDATIDADTPGTQEGRLVHGTYTATGDPYVAEVLQGQQAGATLHMVDFSTGQLFDWFVSGDTAFALVERLPASVIGSPNGGTRETMYTQIVDEWDIGPGPHTVGIEFARANGHSTASFFLDGKKVAHVKRVGVPLDAQGVDYTGIYPSMGAGEDLSDEVDSVVIGHGLFSLLDAFPFQHPDAPELFVSIPLSERLFGQGAAATFDDFVVTTTTLK